MWTTGSSATILRWWRMSWKTKVQYPKMFWRAIAWQTWLRNVCFARKFPFIQPKSQSDKLCKRFILTTLSDFYLTRTTMVMQFSSRLYAEGKLSKMGQNLHRPLDSFAGIQFFRAHFCVKFLFCKLTELTNKLNCNYQRELWMLPVMITPIG